MDIRFKCTACGDCCSSTPSLTMPEAITYRDDWIISTRYALQHSGAGSVHLKDSALAKTTQEAFAYQSGFLPLVKTGSTQAALVGHLITLSYKGRVHHACDRLQEDGHCGIYARRPLACRATPFHMLLPEHLQSVSLNRFVDYGCAEAADPAVANIGSQPGTGDSKPIVFHNGK